ncbi:YcdB/YcdC domain-containing protein [Brevibacillus sp. 179-C9.3 HS]|uniref:YcdB/YcdC domain-containing protein n=1 Tax=unclassified Brevibacillus TaxID=2684853 RepID=UPI0039A1C59C
MKKLNKVIFVVTAATLLATTPIHLTNNGQVLAEESKAKELGPEWKVKVERAIQKVKERLSYLADFSYSTLEILENDDGTNDITIILQTSKEKKKPSFEFSLDEQGNPDTFRYNEEFPEEGRPKIEHDKVVSKATDFMKQWYGADMGSFKYNPNYSDKNNAFFTKQVNGLPYLNVGVYLTVNSKGEVISKGSGFYQLGDDAPALEDLKFADPKEAISKDQAEQAFAKHLKLFYLKRPVVGWDEQTKNNLYGSPTLRYKSEFSEFIDAKTGKEVPVYDGTGSAYNPIVNVNPVGKEVTVKTTEEAAAMFAAFGLESKADKVKEGLSEDTKGKTYTHEINKDFEAEIETQEKTGRFMSYRVVDKRKGEKEVPQEDPNGKKWLTREDSMKLAIAALEKYAPKHLKEVMPIGTAEFGQRLSGQQFKFVSVHEGIPVLDDEIYIRIDRITGEVIGLHMEDVSWEPLILPDPKKAVSHEQAVKEYLKVRPLELQYFTSDVDIESDNRNYQPILVYRTAISLDHREIDALTGKFTTSGEMHYSPY